MAATVGQDAAGTDLDLFAADVLAAPYRYYDQLRNTGAAVYLRCHGVWALTRYADVRAALDDWRQFSSTDGTALNEATNLATRESPLAADPPAHRAPRKVMQPYLTPKAVNRATPDLQARAESLCDALLARGTFDVVSDLARPFALSALADHVGLPPEGREEIADWADTAFDVMGPDNPRTIAARAHLGQLGLHLLAATAADRLAADSAGSAIYEAERRQDIAENHAPQLVSIYLLASIPTVIAAIANAVWLFANDEAQWAQLRAHPDQLPQAVDEILRLESPIQSFTRVLREPYSTGEATIPAGARVILLFGAANRDREVFAEPERFDIARTNASDHLAFSHGLHGCMGQTLARAQIAAVLAALAARVGSWTAGECRWKVNNVLRGVENLAVAVNGAGEPPALAAPRQPTAAMPAAQATEWEVSGSIGVRKLRQSIELPPGTTFTGTVDFATGAMTGEMDRTPVRTGVTVFGFSVGTTSEMIPTGEFDGEIINKPDGTVEMRATSRAFMRIRAFHFGPFTLRVHCRTIAPIEMPLRALGMMSFSYRPSFSGTMTIPPFRGGALGWLLSRIVSGPGNPFEINLNLPTAATQPPPGPQLRSVR